MTPARVSVERYITPFPVLVPHVSEDGHWVVRHRECNQDHTHTAMVGHRAAHCHAGDGYVIAPPGAQQYGYHSYCSECGYAASAMYTPVDLDVSDDGLRLVARYECEHGHSWTSDRWTDPPFGRLPRGPRRCALYFHFDAVGVLLYVGVAESPVARGRQHAYASDWTVFANHFEGQWYDTRELAEAAERVAIAERLPIFNRAHAVGDQKQREADYLLRHGVQLSLFDPSLIGAAA